MHDALLQRARESRSRVSGMTTIELVAAVALAAMAAAVLIGGLRSIGQAAQLAQARSLVIAALRTARSHAYRSETPARVIARAGESTLILQRDGLLDQARTLPAATTITKVPQRAAIRFFANGLADNGTIVVRARDSGGAGTAIVVNQRGVIR